MLDGVPVALAALRRHSHSVEIVEAAVAFLSNLAAAAASHDVLLPALVDVLAVTKRHVGVLGVCVAAMHLLVTLTSSESWATAVRRHGKATVSVVRSVLRRHHSARGAWSELQAWGAAILSRCSVGAV